MMSGCSSRCKFVCKISKWVTNSNHRRGNVALSFAVLCKFNHPLRAEFCSNVVKLLSSAEIRVDLPPRPIRAPISASV